MLQASLTLCRWTRHNRPLTLYFFLSVACNSLIENSLTLILMSTRLPNIFHLSKWEFSFCGVRQSLLRREPVTKKGSCQMMVTQCIRSIYITKAQANC